MEPTELWIPASNEMWRQIQNLILTTNNNWFRGIGPRQLIVSDYQIVRIDESNKPHYYLCKVTIESSGWPARLDGYTATDWSVLDAAVPYDRAWFEIPEHIGPDQ